MEKGLSVLMLLAFVLLVVGLVKPSFVKMKSRWKVFFLFFAIMSLISLGLPKPPKKEITEVVKNIEVHEESNKKDINSSSESALYSIFSTKEPKPKELVKVKEEPKKSDKETWLDYSDDFKVDFVKGLFLYFPSVEKFHSRYGDDALKPMLFSIVDCTDKAFANKKYQDKSLDIILDACMRMELLKNSKR